MPAIAIAIMLSGIGILLFLAHTTHHSYVQRPWLLVLSLITYGIALVAAAFPLAPGGDAEVAVFAWLVAGASSALLLISVREKKPKTDHENAKKHDEILDRNRKS